MAWAQTAKLCELRSLLFTPRDNNVSVLSFFSLFPSLPSLHSICALFLFHPCIPCCTSPPEWPSAIFTPCPASLSPSGWPWCLEHQRRTSCVVTSWGSFPCWWSRPPRTSWVSCSHAWSTINNWTSKHVAGVLKTVSQERIKANFIRLPSNTHLSSHSVFSAVARPQRTHLLWKQTVHPNWSSLSWKALRKQTGIKQAYWYKKKNTCPRPAACLSSIRNVRQAEIFHVFC